MATKTLTLATGNGSAVYMEVESDPNEAAAGGNLELTSAGAGFEAHFEKITQSLAGIAQTMQDQLDKIGPRSPDKVELELSGTLKGKANFWIVEGESAGALKFKLTWEKKADNATG